MPPPPLRLKRIGWLHTGDIGRRDEDGYFYLTDRKRDMIVSGGFNIFPFEVESALLEHPSVQDCAVIGVPDEKWGEAVKACVELKPGSMTSGAEELIAFEKIGSMKAPSRSISLLICRAARWKSPQARAPRTLLAGPGPVRELRARIRARSLRSLNATSSAPARTKVERRPKRAGKKAATGCLPRFDVATL